MQGILPPDQEDETDVLTWLIASANFGTPRLYDLQLDHRGFARIGGESIWGMQTRIRPKVATWWRSTASHPPLNGVFDNSIEGVQILNDFAKTPSPYTYYFTMSFDPTMSRQEIQPTALDRGEFPPHPFFDPLRWITRLFGYPLSAIGTSVFSLFVSVTGINYTRGFMEAIETNLASLGYPDHPDPAARVPRADMLPLLILPAINMGANNQVMGLTGIASQDFEHNDGIVNTPSMRGPWDDQIREIAAFPRDLTAVHSAREAYWHLGINHTMDHADEIGIFTDPDTVSFRTHNQPFKVTNSMSR